MMNEIPALSNSESKLIRKLKQSKYRKKHGLFIAEGERTVHQIVENGNNEIAFILFDSEAQLWLAEQWSELLFVPGEEGAYACRRVEHTDFVSFCDTENPQGVLAVCRIPDEPDPLKLSSQQGVIVACDAIQDPGNLGTMIRTAVWFGAKALIAGHGTVDPYNPKVVRGTAGTTGALPLLKGSLTALLPVFEENEWQILLLDANAAAIPINKHSVSGKTVIVVGNEANGIDRSLFTGDRLRVKIASPETVRDDTKQAESLNAAISLGVALYECTRNIGQEIG